MESLRHDRAAVERELERIVATLACPAAGPVPQAISYAVLGEGQRIRPILAMRAARFAGVPLRPALDAACAVELLHCASLVIDDLPSMDDERQRRGRAAAHIEFGESTAILAGFAMVALAARLVIGQPEFQLALLKTLDCGALIAGQALDLELSGDLRNSQRLRLDELKTVPLFELAALPGGPPLRPFGRRYGLAFQIVDDFLDGEIACSGDVEEHLDAARATLSPLGGDAEPFLELIHVLNARALDCSRR